MTVGLEPNWSHPAPVEAVAAIITAAERASEGDQVGSITAIEAAVVDTRWTAIAGVRILGSLLHGPDQTVRLTALRTEVLRLAAEADADAAVIVLNAETIDLAEAWLSGDLDVLDTITGKTQFLPSDFAKVAGQMIGQIIACEVGDHAPEAFTALRAAYRIEDS